MKKKSNIVLSSLCAILIGFLVMTFHLYKQSQSDVAALQQQVANLNEQVKKAAVVKHISKQMEDIAYQQKDISDKRSDEAIQQSRIANDMRSRADLMRGKAELERVKAEESEKKAVEAYNEARKQRIFAEDKQRQAEYAKRVADTLSYKALARSLGSLSTTQYQIGNKELASLLAYSSWSFANRYQGDVYLPAIYNALSMSSGNVFSKNDNKGAITRIEFTDSPSSFITTTKYGEIIQWDDVMGQMNADVLLRDSKYDFRDLCVEGNNIYAISRNGVLYTKTSQGAINYQLEGDNFIRIFNAENRQLLLISENALMYYSKDGLKLVKYIPLPNKISAVGVRNGHQILFCENGTAFNIEDDGKLVSIMVNLHSTVTAYAWSPSLHLSALGTRDGKIYIMNDKWENTKILSGHRSTITQVTFKGNSLLSSSYDCTVNLWNFNMQKMEPVTLKTFTSWVHCFNTSGNDVIWSGDESGNLSRIVISPFEMANKIKDNLKRDFTSDEWNYYVGSLIPFESYMKH